MTIHFICRGNTYRSIIAEAYLKSLNLSNVTVLSTGTVAEAHRAANEPSFRRVQAVLSNHGILQFAKPAHGDQLTQEALDKGDVTVFLNDNVAAECQDAYELPAKTITWHVIDVGEPGRIAKTEQEHTNYIEQGYHEITKLVDELVDTLNLKK